MAPDRDSRIFKDVFVPPQRAQLFPTLCQDPHGKASTCGSQLEKFKGLVYLYVLHWCDVSCPLDPPSVCSAAVVGVAPADVCCRVVREEILVLGEGRNNNFSVSGAWVTSMISIRKGVNF